MKIKDLEKYVESQRKMNEFLDEGKDILIDLSDTYSTYKFNSFKELMKYFNEEYYGELTKETEVVNENGYITFYVSYEYKNWDIAKKEFYYETRTDKYHIYIYER